MKLFVVKQDEPQEDFPDDASLHIEKEVGRKTSVSVEMAEKLDMAVKENNEDEINTGLHTNSPFCLNFFFTTNGVPSLVVHVVVVESRVAGCISVSP